METGNLPGKRPYVFEDGDGHRCTVLQGAYAMCALLLTSPRFNKPQREIIEEQAYGVKDQLEALDVTFAEPGSGAA